MSKGLVYVPADESDIEFLLWLREQTMTPYLTLAGIPTDEQTHLDRIRYEWANAQIIVWQGAKAGLLKCVQGNEVIEVVQLQIAPEFQGKGIGKAVLGTVLAQAHQQSKKVVLSVLKQNPALRLYERLGFEVTHQDDTSYYLQQGGA